MNTRVNIPTISTVWTLAKDWTFMVTPEYRNRGLMDYLRASGAIEKDAPTYTPEPTLCGAIIPPSELRPRGWPQGTTAMFQMYPEAMTCRKQAGHDGECVRHYNYPRDYVRYQCTMPKGTRLRVDRIYIRKGKANYDSVTFWAMDYGVTKKSVRFWAKLTDVNQMTVTDKPVPVQKAGKIKLAPIRAIILRD